MNREVFQDGEGFTLGKPELHELAINKDGCHDTADPDPCDFEGARAITDRGPCAVFQTENGYVGAIDVSSGSRAGRWWRAARSGGRRTRLITRVF